MSPDDSICVLVVDDDPEMLESIERTLTGLECQVHTAATATDARNACDRRRSPGEREFDLLILDRVLPDADGVELLGELRGTGFAAPTIVITGHPTLETAVDALGYSACDYLEKPFTPEALLERVSQALSAEQWLDRTTYLWEVLRERHGFDHVMSRNSHVLRTYVAAARVASTNTPVLVQGETGTGKEYLAHAIHYMSDRADRHFVAVNCGALPETLLASELFGHEKGAFTSATQAKVGLCEVADRGTLFLDEVGEMSPENQIKLLRFTQDYTFTRLGGVKPIEVDARIIAASNSDLSQAVGHGRFRQDLFYRLNVVPLGLPPLSERPEDLEVFARHFLDKYRQRHGDGPRRISDDAIEALAQQAWPGNLRQLENVIQRALLMADGDTLGPEHLILEEIPAGAGAEGGPGHDPAARFPTLQEIEAQHIARVYEAAGGNKTRTAAILGITRGTLTRKLKQHGIEEG